MKEIIAKAFEEIGCFAVILILGVMMILSTTIIEVAKLFACK